MQVIQADLSDISAQLQIGDVVAFHGDTPVCKVIEDATKSAVSHVAIICEVSPNPLIIQAHFPKVTVDDMATEIATDIDTAIWILPLSAETRKSFDVDKFLSFIRKQIGKEYDFKQCYKAGLIKWLGDKLPISDDEDFTKVFCSELVAGALESAGVIPDLNASRQVPSDVVAMPIYADAIYQVKGEPLEIVGGN
jgi:hypothetical protein